MSIEFLEKIIPDITKILLEEKKVNSENFIGLVSENTYKSNSTAFIASLIPFYLKSNFRVIMLGTNEGLIHYANITRRLGVNVINNLDFYYIDGFYSPYKKEIGEELPLSEQFPYTFNCIKSKNYFECNDLLNASSVVKKILDKINKDSNESTQKKTVLLVDNISSVCSDQLKEVINSIVKISIDEKISTLIGFNTSIIGKENTLYNYIDHLSDFEFEFIDNESGFSKDIDGKLKISFKGQFLDSTCSVIYKIKENCIEFMQHLSI